MHYESRFTELMIDGEDKTAEIQEFGNVIGIHRAAPTRVSTLLLIELYTRAWIAHSMNPAKVVREIEWLEGNGTPTRTKPAAPFNGSLLRGLWHKHYLVDGLPAMARNLLNGLRQNGIPLFKQRIRGALEANEERYITEEDVKLIAYDAVIGNYERRADAGQLTGEWIIYAQHAGQNYYLCLGEHNTGDEKIRAKIESMCVPEFPWVSELLG